MTRIALLPSSYPPALGGVEELTRHLALSLIEAGDQVEVWTCLADDRRETVEILDGLVVRRLPMPLPATHWTSLRRTAVVGPRTLFSLRNAVAAFRPDLLHVQCFGPNGAYATALSRTTGRPLVVTLQGETMMDDADIFEESRTLRAALRWGLKRAAAVTGCSAFTLADAESRFGLAPGRGQVVFNGVVLDRADRTGADPAPSARAGNHKAPGGGAGSGLTGSRNRPYLLALGRVVEKKGFDLLLSAYGAIDPDHRSADLVIGGAGAALPGLEQLAADLGVADQVHFVGRLSREEVASAMAGATAFIMPSRLEPFGIVILEGWRAGVAVVATNRGGPPEFVEDGTTGVLVDPFDTAQFAAALQALLDDPARRSAIAAAGHQRVQEFDWPVITEQYRRIYRSVLGDPEVSPAPSGPAARATRVGESVR